MNFQIFLSQVHPSFIHQHLTQPYKMKDPPIIATNPKEVSSNLVQLLLYTVRKQKQRHQISWSRLKDTIKQLASFFHTTPLSTNHMKTQNFLHTLESKLIRVGKLIHLQLAYQHNNFLLGNDQHSLNPISVSLESLMLGLFVEHIKKIRKFLYFQC